MVEDEKRACQILLELIQDLRAGRDLPKYVLRLYINEHQESNKENIDSYYNLLKELFQVMKTTTSRIDTIVLSGRSGELSNEEYKNFVSAIETIGTLKSLKIYRVTSITNDIFGAGIIKNNNSIVDLDLSCNNIGDACCATIAESMKCNKTIKKLVLSQNQIGNDGCVAIAKLLENNKALTYLAMSANQIGEFGCMELAKVLEKHNNALESLRIAANNIGDKGALALAKMVKMNSTLLHLRLCRNNISDIGFVALAEALKYNYSLIELYYFGNQVTSNGISTMQDTLHNSNFSLHLFQYNGVDPGGFFSILNQNRDYSCKKFIRVNMNTNVDITRDFYLTTMIRGCQMNHYRRGVVTNILYDWMRQYPSLIVDDQFIREIYSQKNQ